MMRLLPALLAIAFLAAAIPDAMAQSSSSALCDHPDIGCCGDEEFELVLLNPDLSPGADGFIHASGNFFVQFQAISPRAAEITTFGFSFGLYTTTFPEDVCELPPQAWFTGQQVINYRADTNPDDGFFINLQTPLVPDGRYTAAIHAYDDSNNELARFWASAIVENCDTAADPLGQIERCGDDPAQLQRVDSTMPWPIVLPGDGLTPDDVDGFTIEFAEALSNFTVYLNGQDITQNMTSWEGREWDNDYFPGYGPYGLSAILVPECSTQPPQDCVSLGEAYQWTERRLTNDDVLRVEAYDLAGNFASKDLHIGSGVTSGAITDQVPILGWAVDRVSASVQPGQPAEFKFTISNSGGDTGHPFARDQAPEGWKTKWDPPHVPVATGESEDQKFVVTPAIDAAAGTYEVKAFMDYKAGSEDKVLQQTLQITVLSGLPGGQSTPTPEGEPEGEEDSPNLPLAVILGALAAAIMLRRK